MNDLGGTDPRLGGTAQARGTGLPDLPRRRIGIWLLLGLPLVLLLLGFFGLAASHAPIPVPQALLTRIEARANAALAGRVMLHLGRAELVVESGFVPEVRLGLVQISQPSGLPLAVLPDLRARFRPDALAQGRIAPKSFRLVGASVALYRFIDGRIDLDLGGTVAEATAPTSGPGPFDLTDPNRLTDAIEALFATPLLADVTEIAAEDLHIRLVDERLQRIWEVSQGQLRLTQTPEDIALTLAFDVGEQNRLPAQVALTAFTSKRGPAADFGAAVTDLPAGDLAAQNPALAMLGLLDAPISGVLRSGITDTGALRHLDARLHIGAGALRPAEGVKPVAFEGADLHLTYEPKAQRIDVSRLVAQSRALRLSATGQVWLRDFAKGLPREALAQLRLSDIASDPEGLFDRPARFSQGALDLRLRLDPFRLDLGQMQLVEGARRISGRGQVAVVRDGWHLAFDMAVGAISSADLVALWPKALVPQTRDWLVENVATGELRNVHAAVRLDPAMPPRLELSHEFRGAEVKVLRTLPPMREGRGFAGLTENRHTLMVEEGRLDAPEGGQVEVADSVMTVPDIREKPARAEVRLVTRAPLRAVLSLLDQEPFNFLSKSGRDIDIVEGWAEARSTLRFSMEKKITPEEVDYDVLARLTEVTSDKIVPGHIITAERLTLSADRAGMTVSGAGKFDIVPFQGRWAQRFGPEFRDISRVDGFVEITPKGLEHLKIALPKGALAGEGWGHLAVDLVKDKPPAYEFVTDLKGLKLALPEIGWSKPTAATGRLELAGHLGPVASVERLKASAPELDAEGRLQLGAGGFEKASFTRLAVGTWFDGAVDLIGRGKGRAPDVTLRSGRLDLRHARFGAGAQGGGNRIEAQLDRLVVSDGIALAPMAGNFTSRGGFSGAFHGRVNGGPSVTGSVVPAKGGRAAVRITGTDAGAVLAAAGMFGKAQGGALDLTLTPVAAKSYDGRLSIRNLRVQGAPVLASMLSAASVIGLLQQLNGEGLVFSDVEGQFHLSPQGVSVTRGEAVGASMGVTMTGNYYPDSKGLDMSGVVTPFYMINSIGQLISRRGEGVFGFTYRLHGTSGAPHIAVNPLSIFTPGMLREIFRRAPPKLVSE